MKSRQQGKFSSDTEINPKDNCKAITLRSGKEVGENIRGGRAGTNITRKSSS